MPAARGVHGSPDGTRTPDVPAPSSFVSDRGDLLTEEEEQHLNARLSQIDSISSVQIAVLTLPTLGDERIEDVALRVGREWGVGQADINNGILVRLSAADRAVRIQVGTGLEWQISDAASARVIAAMLPHFRKQSFAEGLRLGTDALAELALSVPWTVDFASPRAARESPAPVGRIVRVCGVYAREAVETEAGPILVTFPPYWTGTHAPYETGQRVHVLARVAGTDPLTAQALGEGRAAC